MLRRWIICFLLAVLLGLALSGPAIAFAIPNTVQPSSAQIRTAQPTMPTMLPPSPLQGTWAVSLGARRFEDEFNQKSTTDFRLGAELTYRPLELLEFRVLPSFRSSSGYTQTIDDKAQGSGSGSFLLREASANLSTQMMAKSNLRLSIGALNEEAIHSNLMFSEDLSFPAVRLTLSSNPQAIFVAGVHAQTAIVTASSLSTQTQSFEKTPTFQSQVLFLKLQKTAVEATLSAGMFGFGNLPTSVATRSALLGNTTDSTTALDSTFRYAYQGSLANGDLRASFNRYFAVGAGAAWLQNRAAPQNQNEGSVYEAYSDLDFSRSFQLTPFYQYFRIQSDATVASLNSETLNTNRVGYSAGFRMGLAKLVKLSLSGGERDVLTLSPTQARERTWNLRLETFDVAI